MSEISGELGLIQKNHHEWCRHPLAYLVEAADDICYSIIDLEDGIEMGAITFDDYQKSVRDHIWHDRHAKPWKQFYKTLDEPAQKVSYLRSKAIIIMVEQVVDAFIKNEKSLLSGTFIGSLLNKCPGGAFIESLKKVAENRIFPHPRKRFLEISSYTVLHGLLDDFGQAAVAKKNLSKKHEYLLSLMGADTPNEDDSTYERLRKVVDFVSGMTDHYALEMYRQLRGISVGGAIRPPLLRAGPNLQP